MYYRYNEDHEIIEKSVEPLEGDNVVTYWEDIDIQLFRVVVGYIDEDGTMLRHTKLINDGEEIARLISSLKEDLGNAEVKSDLLSEQVATQEQAILELSMMIGGAM